MEESAVGMLRQGSALCDTNDPVIIVTDDERLRQLLKGRRLKVVKFYPDSTDGVGEFNHTFKIKVVLE